MKYTAIAALLGLVEAGKIPMIKKDLTREKIYRQLNKLEKKFGDIEKELGIGEKATPEHITITDFMDAQYFIKAQVGTPG